MNIEISLSPSQLRGRLPVYINGKRYWLLSSQQVEELKRKTTPERVLKLNELTKEKSK